MSSPAQDTDGVREDLPPPAQDTQDTDSGLSDSPILAPPRQIIRPSITPFTALVRATLPSALNMMNASPVGKLVQLVTASRLILYHEGQIDPMKDECHYQIKH